VIKTVIKLAFVALVANATWHLFSAYSPHFKFKDGVQYAVEYRDGMTDAALRVKILELAAQFEVPMTDADLSVTHEERRTMVAVSYVRPVALAPGFTYPWPFSFHLDAFHLATVKPDP
jgi:hypothetical protein